MSYGITPVQVPEFNATWDRGQAARGNALAMQAQEQQFRQSQGFNNALANYGPGLGSANDPKRMASLMALMQSGPQGAALAMPMLQQERDNAAFFGPSGMAAPPTDILTAPAEVAAPGRPNSTRQPLPMGSLADGQPAAASTGDDPAAIRRRNAFFAAARERVLSNPNLSAEQQQNALAQLSAAAAGAGGTPERPGGYRANPGTDGVFAGLAPPTGAVAGAGPGAAPAMPSAPAGRPGAATGLAGIDPAMVQRAVVLAARGNQAAARFLHGVQVQAAVTARDNPNFQTATADGRVIAFNPRNPAERMDLGAAAGHDETVPVPDPRSSTGWRYEPRRAAGGQAAPAPDGYRPGQGEKPPFGNGADGLALASLEALAPAIRNGTASEEDVRRYLSAANRVQEERVQPDGTRVTPRLPAYAPGVDWVAHRYGIQAPAAGGASERPREGGAAALPPAEGGSQRALQQPPQQVATAMLENVRALRAAQEAARQITATPDAFGLTMGAANMVPGVIDRVNPSGVNARAAVAELSSIKIHDLSGASVTASEFPRLRPFIPSVSDPPEVVAAKVQRFARELEGVLRDQYSTFGPTAGFRSMDPVEQALRPAGGGAGGQPAPGARAAAADAVARARRELGASADDEAVVRRAQELMR